MNRHISLLIVVALVVSGCASLFNKPTGLIITIEPNQLQAGSIVTVTANSPRVLEKLTGRINRIGSPVISLKTKDGKNWTWKTQVPLEVAWQAGRYQLIFEGQEKSGKKIFGEAWVEAP